jgi:hypothetical protein
LIYPWCGVECEFFDDGYEFFFQDWMD